LASLLISLFATVFGQEKNLEVIRADDLQVSKVVIKSKPKPHYPKLAHKQHIGATIVLRAIFRASGKVTDVKFSKVMPADLSDDLVSAFTEECMKVAPKIKFKPATKNGHPVSMYVQLEYAFYPD